MVVNESTMNLYLQLGIAGATLLIMLVFVVLLFKFITKDNSRVDKLCDKIDKLITSYAENSKEVSRVLLSNDKDQKETIKLLTSILTNTNEVLKKVVRIDDRTYFCLGDKTVEKKEK